MSKTKIIQLDKSHVKVFGELKDVLIRLSSNSKVHQTIDIIVVDILEAYGVILNRDWSAKLNGYFSIDWSHLWLPYKGQPNNIKVDRENYMKHMVTDLNDPNEMVMCSKSTLGNFNFNTFFEELEGELSHTAYSDKQYELLHSNQIAELNNTLVDYSNDASIDSSSCTLLNSSFTNTCTQLTNHNLWTLYFDVSRNKHGEDAGCLLIHPCGIRTYFSCHLESKCTNNDAKYEALTQGLRKAIDLKVKSIEVFGDSQLVTKHVRNFMFNTFHHLNKHRQEEWNLISKFDSFDIKSIPYKENYDTIMLIDEASNLNPDYDSIYMKIDDETCRPLIPFTNWRNSNDDRYTSNGSMMKDKQHESFLQALVSDQNSEMQYLLENHFSLQDTFKRTINEYSQ
jgi:ribonuclease HI